MKLDNAKLDRYEYHQRMVLHLTRRLIDGERCEDKVLSHYSKMCIGFKPSHAERALNELVKHVKRSREVIP